MRVLHRLGALALALVLVSATLARADSLADSLVAAYRNSNLLEQNRALLRANIEKARAMDGFTRSQPKRDTCPARLRRV